MNPSQNDNKLQVAMKALANYEKSVDEAYRIMDVKTGQHEYIDTCVVYKGIHKLRTALSQLEEQEPQEEKEITYCPFCAYKFPDDKERERHLGTSFNLCSNY